MGDFKTRIRFSNLWKSYISEYLHEGIWHTIEYWSDMGADTSMRAFLPYEGSKVAAIHVAKRFKTIDDILRHNEKQRAQRVESIRKRNAWLKRHVGDSEIVNG